MKLRTLFNTTTTAACAFLAVATVGNAAPQTVAGRPVLWSVHFDAQRLRSGVGQELFANLDPILTTLSGTKTSSPGGKLESVAIFGFEPKKDARRDLPFLATVSFSAEGGGIAQRFDTLTQKHGAPVEVIAGYPTIHFPHEGRDVWIAKTDDQHVFLTASRSVLDEALKSPPTVLASTASPAPNEVLSGNVEIKPLLKGNPDLDDSELLRLVPHLDFHLTTEGEEANLNASAELENEVSAKRAARMIDGMIAMMATHDKSGVPWDDRVEVTRDGANLSLRMHLQPGEAKKLFSSIIQEAKSKAGQHKHDDDE